MSQPTAVVIGALIGALAAISGSLATSLLQGRLERYKLRRQREDTVLGELTNELAGLSHSMMWATFKALAAKEVAVSAVEAYEKELHQGIAGVVRAQMYVAAFNRSLYERVTPRVSEVIELGGDTYQLLLTAVKDFRSVEQQLLARNGQALTFIKRLPVDFAGLLRS